MSGKYNVCPLFWTEGRLKNMGVLEKLLDDGWKIIRRDTMPQSEIPTIVYILEKQSEDTK